MGLKQYRQHLFLGRTGQPVKQPVPPYLRLLLGIGGVLVILISLFDQPLDWREIVGLVLGSIFVLTSLGWNLLYSPFYLRFTESGLSGRLWDVGRFYLHWNQVESMSYRDEQLTVCGLEGEQMEIPISQVDFRHREAVLPILLQIARQQGVEVEEDVS